MGTRKVTVADAIEAMRQNNIPFTSGALTRGRYDGNIGIIDSACALGQCAINLGANPESLQRALSRIPISTDYIPSYLASYIITQNDTFHFSPDKVASSVRAMLTEEQLNQVIEVETEFSIVELKAS